MEINHKSLQAYSKRQVIINFFEEEELVNREGFNFEFILVESNSLSFYRNQELICKLNLNCYTTFKKMTAFNHYFMFANQDESKIMEVYFP